MFRPMDWGTYAATVAGAVISGVAILWIVAGYYHVRYYRLRRHEPETWKCQPKRWPTAKQQKKAMMLSTMNLSIGGLITGNLVYALTHGWKTPIYFDVADYGWAWSIGGTVVLFVLVDGAAYYMHRFMHTKLFYRYVHSWHHRYGATSPWVVTAMHPVEFLTFQVGTFLPLFLLPFHYVSVIVVFVYILVFNIIDHSGVRLRSMWPWQGPSTYHDDHHLYFHVNFGQHLMLWDRMHGTLRRVSRKYGEDRFGGKGEPGADTEPREDEFVRY